ncbi:hypothetical protein HZA45_01675 [Candidatus Peregrinibacteria bacterium]|nr:hypothetical protein [Candidatus Peregrinibacteria bacterium]
MEVLLGDRFEQPTEIERDFTDFVIRWHPSIWKNDNKYIQELHRACTAFLCEFDNPSLTHWEAHFDTFIAESSERFPLSATALKFLDVFKPAMFYFLEARQQGMDPVQWRNEKIEEQKAAAARIVKEVRVAVIFGVPLGSPPDNNVPPQEGLHLAVFPDSDRNEQAEEEEEAGEEIAVA